MKRPSAAELKQARCRGIVAAFSGGSPLAVERRPELGDAFRLGYQLAAAALQKRQRPPPRRLSLNF